MGTGYIIEYSEIHFAKQSEVKKAFVKAKKLAEMLNSGRFAVWNAHWVNPEITDISEYKTLN